MKKLDKSAIYIQIKELIRNITQNISLEIDDDTLFSDIENWDSLNTVDLEIEIESNMDIDFDTGEFQTYKSVQELVIAIEKKLNID